MHTISYKDYGYIDKRIVLSNFATGAVLGALSMTSMKRASLTVASAVLAGTTYISEQVIKDESIKTDELLASVAFGTLGGYAGGDGMNSKSLSNVWKSAENAIEREVRRANKNFAKRKFGY